jgi:lupus La protein
MWTLYTKDLDHWAPVQIVASFDCMRDFISLGVEWVAKALRFSEELEMDETGAKVRRRTEVQEPESQFERSVYAVWLALLRLTCFK